LLLLFVNSIPKRFCRYLFNSFWSWVDFIFFSKASNEVFTGSLCEIASRSSDSESISSVWESSFGGDFLNGDLNGNLGIDGNLDLDGNLPVLTFSSLFISSFNSSFIFISSFNSSFILFL